MDLKLEVVVVPVSDVDRAKDFYKRLGFREDIDYSGSEGYRAVQLTPPGSGCSIIFGKGVTAAPPGSIDRLVLAVNDIAAARRYLEVRNDAGDCNLSNLILVGAKEGAALGSLWIAEEWQRPHLIQNPINPLLFMNDP